MIDKQNNFYDLQTCHFDQELLKDIPLWPGLPITSTSFEDYILPPPNTHSI